MKSATEFSLALLCGLGTVSTSQASEVQLLDPVTVTATLVGKPGSAVPAAMDVVPLRDTSLGVSLAESLQGIPGVAARDRQNYAQDTQISIRGFGTRSPFGIRGVRLLLDGIPATQPDGQGQITHFNLATAGRVEVLRGPFSALYGNSSGGVVQVDTADRSLSPGFDIAAFGGAYGDRRLSLVGAGDGWTAGYSRISTDGQRPQSAATRHSVNTKMQQALGDGRLTLLLNHFDGPNAEDPLGLTRAQFEADPRQTAAAAIDFDTRKSAGQTQVGAIYQQNDDGAGALRLMTYAGTRDIEQFLAIPVATQSNPRNSGGVVDLNTAYGGGDLRWSRKGPLLTLVAGTSIDLLRQQRRGFENFVGTQRGVKGRLRRDEVNDVTAFDQYLQADLRLAERWASLIGARYSTVRFTSRDRYIEPGNPNDSGAVRYQQFTPVAGLMFRQRPMLHWYAAYGTGFETPTFAELAYRADGEGGLNFALDPAITRNTEFGLKARLAPATRLNLAAFHAATRNELVVVSNSGGRAAYANATRTRRQGLEGSLQGRLTETLDFAVALTLLDAEVRQSYATCTAVPCLSPQTTVERGNQLPGVAQGQLFTRLAYQPRPTFTAAVELRYLDALPVNDINSEFAPSSAVVDLESSYRLALNSQQTLRGSIRLENLLDEHYAGSIIVNDGNGRYYEPARGRSLMAGVEWSFARPAAP